MARISRRTFLFGSVAAMATAGLGGFLAWRRNTAETFVMHAVTRNLPGYEIDGAALQRFATEYLRQEHNIMQARSVKLAMRMRQIFFWDFARNLAPQQIRYEMLWLERRIVTRFAQSTDLLYADADNRKVTYVGYWDPYRTGCANTMARYDYD